MKFMLTFNWKPDTKTREEGIARFRNTGSAASQRCEAPGALDESRLQWQSALVTNVRRGATVPLAFADTYSAPVNQLRGRSRVGSLEVPSRAELRSSRNSTDALS
jgi:hypothetical protein